MQKIEATIRSFKLEEVREMLISIGIHAATVTEVQVHNHRRKKGETSRGSPNVDAFIPRIKLEVVVPDEQWRVTTDAILRASKTGIFGDGKIFVLPVVDAIRIRTEEHGANAV